MAVTEQDLNAGKSRGAAGRKAGGTEEREDGNPGKRRKRDGVARLRKLLDQKVAEHTEELAAVLTNKALSGDVATTRLVVELAEGGKPKVKPRKEKKRVPGLCLVRRWAHQKEWKKGEERRLEGQGPGM
jgi:hypothetical protein